jgi:hypothetical protein
MKMLLAKRTGLTKRPKVLVSIISVIVMLFAFTGGLFASDYKTIHFHPSDACVGVGDMIYLDMYGWGWKTAGTKWQSENKDIAKASGHGEVTGVKVGKTEFHLKDGFNHTIKSVDVTVKKDTADCVSEYMKGANTAPPQYEQGKTSFKFVFVSDTQGCSGCSAAEGKNLVDHDFAKWFADQMINVENPAFIVNGGDLSGLGGLGKQYGKQWLDDVKIMWKNGNVPAGKAAIPIYAVVGNHDLTRVVLGESWKSKQEDWQKELWPYYFNNGGKKWPTNVSDDYKYLVYSFAYGNSVFVFTDTRYMWGNAGNDKDWLGNMMIDELNPAQVAYVEKELQWAKSQGKTHTFVFGHAPILPDPKQNNKTMAALMEKSGISGAYICGHSHKLEHKSFSKTPFEQFIAGTGGGDCDPNSYLRVEVNGNAWTVTAVARDHKGKVWEGTVEGGTKWVYTK